MKNTVCYDRIAGCLIGGAAGDALGYAVEFMPRSAILKAFGERGICEYSRDEAGIARISDDTQMTLFTASGLLSHVAEPRGMKAAEHIYEAYRKWYLLQSGDSADADGCPIANLPEMRSRRAPGNTCMSALRAELSGTVEWHINDSKGCGGVMRAAPAAFMFDDVSEAMRVAADAAALTHGHPLGYLSAAALSYIVFFAARSGDPLCDIAENSKNALVKLFPGEKMCAEMNSAIDRALALSQNPKPDWENVAALGQGWVGEEALAIALYSVVRHQDFSDALIAAVNHGGDSDSTGAIAGNIIGARLGLSAIPEKWLADLELKDDILDISRDIANANDRAGLARYVRR